MVTSSPTPAGQSSSQFEAALWMVASGVMFTVHIALGKFLSGEYDPGLLAFYRSVLSLIWAAPFALRLPLKSFVTKKPGLIIFRSILGTSGFLMGFYAFSEGIGVSLSEYNAISFSRSLFIVVMAALLLGEVVGTRRWIAAAVGFVGVLIMVRPETGLSAGSLLAVGSAMCFAGAIILVKTLSAHHSPLVLLTYANALSAILTLPFAVVNWKTPETFTDAGWISGMALAGVLAQTCYITGMSKGDASFLSTIDYLRLPMTATADWLVFQEFPGPIVWLGAAIIVTSTLYITWRESRLRKS